MQIDTLLRLLEERRARNIEARLKDFYDIVGTLRDLEENLHTAKVKLEFWEKYLEVQMVKFTLHSLSIAYLIEGTPLKIRKSQKELIYPDLGSIYLIGRAQLECYLTFYYLNIQPESFEEGEFRYYLYELSGLSRRQQFGAKIKEHVNQKMKEHQKIQDLIDKLERNKYFIELPEKTKKFLLKKKPARTMGWIELIESSHLNSEMFVGSWKLYSNYAHSEMIGSIQISDYILHNEEFQITLFQTLEHSLLPICIMIKDLASKFKTTELLFNALPQSLITKIDFWCRIGTEQNK